MLKSGRKSRAEHNALIGSCWVTVREYFCGTIRISFVFWCLLTAVKSGIYLYKVPPELHMWERTGYKDARRSQILRENWERSIWGCCQVQGVLRLCLSWEFWGDIMVRDKYKQEIGSQDVVCRVHSLFQEKTLLRRNRFKPESTSSLCFPTRKSSPLKCKFVCAGTKTFARQGVL